MGASKPTVRTCVVTRMRRPSDDLLRVGVQDGRIILDPQHRLPGRGAWVSASKEALLRLEAKPELSWRTLRVRHLPAASLLEPAQEDARRRVIRALALCHRSGLLRSASIPAAGPNRVSDGEEPVVIAPTGWMALIIQKLLRCPPPTLLQLQPGKPSRLLLRELRRLEALG